MIRNEVIIKSFNIYKSKPNDGNDSFAVQMKDIDLLVYIIIPQRPIIFISIFIVQCLQKK